MSGKEKCYMPGATAARISYLFSKLETGRYYDQIDRMESEIPSRDSRQTAPMQSGIPSLESLSKTAQLATEPSAPSESEEVKPK